MKCPATVRVLTFEGCPHAQSAKLAARAAVAQSPVALELVEVDLGADTTPSHLKRYPSPTVLVGDDDVSGIADFVGGTACRSSGAPSVSEIRRAIERYLGNAR